jgi:hypothetical protein|tara:strand:- start:756 stop:2108 length:1353 start_codon:yes stop_codon:yes gene_type:complete
MKGMLKKSIMGLSAIAMLFLFSVMVSAACSGSCGTSQGSTFTLTKLDIEVNDVDLSTASTSQKELLKEDELDVLVVFQSNTDLEDVVIVAELTGYDKSDRVKINDESDTFDVTNGTIYDKRMELELPTRFEQGQYSLKVRIETKTDTFTQTYPVYIDAEEHSVEIRDVVLSPADEVRAGRALLISARIKNRGENDEEDIKVTASIPALGVRGTDFIDELDSEDCTGSSCDDSITSEEIYLRIPDCAEPGEYTVAVTVEFDDGDEEVTRTSKVRVVESDLCPVHGGSSSSGSTSATGKTVITIGPESQTVAKGATANYPLTLSNEGSSSRTYTVEVSAPWANVAISPSNVLVVGAGESKAAFIGVTPSGDASGEQLFSVTVKSGDAVLKQVPLKATVAGKSYSPMGKAKKALEVGIVVFVVLLVILGLIIGFNKLKGSDDEEGKEDDEAYY